MEECQGNVRDPQSSDIGTEGPSGSSEKIPAPAPAPAPVAPAQVGMETESGTEFSVTRNISIDNTSIITASVQDGTHLRKE